VQNEVGDSAYGVYFAILDFCFLFQVILDAGIQNYNSKHVSQNRNQVSEHFAHVLGTKLILIFLFLVSVFGFAFLIDYPKDYYPIILLMGVVMSAQTFYVYLRSHFSALGKYKYETWLSALDKILMILVIGYLIYIAKNISIGNFLYGQLLALVIAIFIAILFLKNQFSLSIDFNIKKSKSLLKNSLPFALVFLLMTLYTRMDGVMLERLLEDDAIAAGQYAKGFRLLDAANMIGYLFSVFLLPMFARLLGEKKDTKPLVLTAVKIQLTFSTIISLVCWFYAKEILELIYTNVTTQTISSFKFLMVSFWAMAMSYIFGSLITASGKLKLFNTLFIVGILINWALNLYLIPLHQAIGAAIATVATQFFVFGGQFILASVRFRLLYGKSFIIKAFLLMGIYFAAIYIMSQLLQLNWLIEVFLFCIICLGLSFLFGFLRFSNSLRA